jgi:hypothetical protein
VVALLLAPSGCDAPPPRATHGFASTSTSATTTSAPAEASLEVPSVDDDDAQADQGGDDPSGADTYTKTFTDLDTDVIDADDPRCDEVIGPMCIMHGRN